MIPDKLVLLFAPVKEGGSSGSRAGGGGSRAGGGGSRAGGGVVIGGVVIGGGAGGGGVGVGGDGVGVGGGGGSSVGGGGGGAVAAAGGAAGGAVLDLPVKNEIIVSKIPPPLKFFLPLFNSSDFTRPLFSKCFLFKLFKYSPTSETKSLYPEALISFVTLLATLEIF